MLTRSPCCRFTVECWNTFANWGILRDFQLDAAVCAVLVVWGVLGDALGSAATLAALAVRPAAPARQSTVEGGGKIV